MVDLLKTTSAVLVKYRVFSAGAHVRAQPPPDGGVAVLSVPV